MHAALTDRGQRKLQFESQLEFRDPRGVVDALWPESLAALRGE